MRQRANLVGYYFKDFNVDISSTNFREHMDPSKVNQDVFDYIQEYSLYRGDDDVQ